MSCIAPPISCAADQTCNVPAWSTHHVSLLLEDGHVLLEMHDLLVRLVERLLQLLVAFGQIIQLGTRQLQR